MSLALDGDALFVGGFFERIGGVRRMNLASVDVADAGVLP